MGKILKEQPKPGRLTNLTVSVNSIVNNPANNEEFLIKKGMEKMYLNDDEKKQLQAAGISPDEISKNESVFSKVVKFFTGKTEPSPEPKPEVLTVQKVSEIVKNELQDFLKQNFTEKLKKNDDSNDIQNTNEDEIKKENEDLKKKIEEEQNLQKNQSDLIAENQRLKKSYEELLSARMPGNASTASDNQNIQKNDDPESWKDGFFDE